MQLKPDPTFYASPKDAMKAPPETLAYVALLSASGNGVPIGSRSSIPIRPHRDTARKSAASNLPIAATNCTTSAGTRAAPACVRIRRIRTSSAATWSFRVCDRRASIFSTRSRIRANPKIVKIIEPETMMTRDRVQSPAHRSLRARRHLRQRARCN